MSAHEIFIHEFPSGNDERVQYKSTIFNFDDKVKEKIPELSQAIVALKLKESDEKSKNQQHTKKKTTK